MTLSSVHLAGKKMGVLIQTGSDQLESGIDKVPDIAVKKQF